MWSEQPTGPQQVASGSQPGQNSSAAALLAYDVGHRAPWDWRVSLYTWTKSLASGTYLAALLLVLLGKLGAQSAVWMYTAPLISALFLLLTGAILIFDLEHPERFYLIFTRPQWRSWLVRGGVLISAYGALLALHLLLALLGDSAALRPLAVLLVPASILAAVYTAFLFGQSKGRDLWQSPLLAPHLVVQALLVGSAMTLLETLVLAPAAAPGAAALLAASAVVHLLLVLAESTHPHVSAHAHQAVHHMVAGRFARWFWAGVALVALAAAASWIASLAPVAAALALVGLLAHEHAYVQSAQAVPLA